MKLAHWLICIDQSELVGQKWTNEKLCKISIMVNIICTMLDEFFLGSTQVDDILTDEVIITPLGRYVIKNES